MMRRARGFTLVELLACLVLVGAVLPVAMSAISVATSASGLARRQLEATILAQSKLNELTVSGAWMSSDPTGDFGADWPDYHWALATSDYDGATLQQLDLTVSWTMRGKERSVTMSTVVYAGGR